MLKKETTKKSNYILSFDTDDIVLKKSDTWPKCIIMSEAGRITIGL